MTLKFADAVAIAQCNAAVDAIDLGAADGSVEIYNSPRPANPSVAITSQTKLVDFVLPAVAFGAAGAVTGGAQATANAVDGVAAAANGTASWFRIFDGDGNALWDGDVSDTAGSGDMKVSSTTIVSGVEVSIVSWTFTQPKGW